MKHNLFQILKNFILGGGLVLAIWYMAYVIIDRNVMPSPLVVLSRFPELINHNILGHLVASLWRILVALIVSMIIGLTLGLLMNHKVVRHLLSPFIYFTYPIPRVALLPVVILVFGLGDLSTIIMICLIIIYPIAIVVGDTLKNLPREHYHGLISLGASPFQMFVTITLPWALSAILSTLRISLGTAIAILFFTETYGTNLGMGFFILDMWVRFNYVMMFAGIVALSLVGFLLFAVVDVLEDRFLKWRQRSRS